METTFRSFRSFRDGQNTGKTQKRRLRRKALSLQSLRFTSRKATIQHDDAEQLPVGSFNEAVSFDDAKPPFPGWNPNPSQISAACLLIQKTWTIEEKQRRLRVDLRPTVRCADGRHVDVTADDYAGHHRERELIEARAEG